MKAFDTNVVVRLLVRDDAAQSLAAAVELYELGRLSSGAAAQLADIPRPLFLAKLADYDASTFRLNREELAEDLANA